jgi:hypothetical protein
MDTSKILNTIKESGVKPIDRKYFILRRIGIVLLGVFVTLLGGFVFAKIIADILSASWQDWDYIFSSFRSFLVFVIPLSWVLMLVVFTAFLPFVWEKTSSGYKYKKIILVLVSVLSSVILGLGILKIGSYFGINDRILDSAEKREVYLWTNPEKGRLSGSVSSRGTDSIFLQDYRGKIWAVDISNVFDLSKKTVENFDNVKIIGVKIEDNTFLACQILPFEIKTLPNADMPFKEIDTSGSSLTQDICKLVLKNSL